jgi:hypothetical protein
VTTRYSLPQSRQKCRGDERLVPVVGDPGLVLTGEVAAAGWLEADVDGVALGQEPVQPEGEQGPVQFPVPGLDTDAQHGLDGAVAHLGRLAARVGQQRGRLRDRERWAADEPPTGLLDGQPHGVLDPDREGVPAQGLVLGRKLVGRSGGAADRVGEGFAGVHSGYGVGARVGRTLQGLADDTFRFDLCAEQACGDVGDVLPGLGEGDAGRHSG